VRSRAGALFSSEIFPARRPLKEPGQTFRNDDVSERTTTVANLGETTAQGKPALERATAGYDPAFERELADVIIRAIADASMIDGVMVIRTGESAAALVNVLATMMALSPAAARNRAAIKQTADGFRRKLAAKVRAAEGSPDIYEFKQRVFHDGDPERGGRA
jgi:hypothetical protein